MEEINCKEKALYMDNIISNYYEYLEGDEFVYNQAYIYKYDKSGNALINYLLIGLWYIKKNKIEGPIVFNKDDILTHCDAYGDLDDLFIEFEPFLTEIVYRDEQEEKEIKQCEEEYKQSGDINDLPNYNFTTYFVLDKDKFKTFLQEAKDSYKQEISKQYNELFEVNKFIENF